MQLVKVEDLKPEETYFVEVKDEDCWNGYNVLCEIIESRKSEVGNFGKRSFDFWNISIGRQCRHEKNYNITWRCWLLRPDKSVSDSVPWDLL